MAAITNKDRIRMSSSVATAQLRGVASTPTAGLTISGAYIVAVEAHEFLISVTGPYTLWEDPLGGSSYVQQTWWSGAEGKIVLGRDAVSIGNFVLADAYSTIAEAVAVMSAARPILLLGPKDYLITAAITVAFDNFTIFGVGVKSRIYTVTNINGIDTAGYDDCRFLDFKLYGNGSYIGIHVSGNSLRALCSNLFVTNWGSGIAEQDTGTCRYTQILNCNLSGNRPESYHFRIGSESIISGVIE